MFKSQSHYKSGKNKIFTRNTLSLPDKVRVIKAFKNEPNFNNLANSFQCSTHQIKSIISSKDAILAQHNLIVSRIEVAKRDPPKKSQDQPQGNENEKVSLLNKVMFEWYLRAKCYPALNPITYKIIREKIVEAKEVLVMPDFTATNTWLVNFRNECKKGRDARKQRERAQLPLDMKSIALDVMLREGGLKKDKESTNSTNGELEKPILKQPSVSEQESMSIDEEVINLDSSDDESRPKWRQQTHSGSTKNIYS